MTHLKPYMHITSTILRVANEDVTDTPADAALRALQFKGLKSGSDHRPVDEVEPEAPAALRGNPEQFVTGAGVRK
jgi:hypothetical protein